MHACVCMCVCVCVRACARSRARARVCVCVCVCVTEAGIGSCADARAAFDVAGHADGGAEETVPSTPRSHVQETDEEDPLR